MKGYGFLLLARKFGNKCGLKLTETETKTFKKDMAFCCWQERLVINMA